MLTCTTTATRRWSAGSTVDETRDRARDPPVTSADFVPEDFAVPTTVTFGDVRLVPLGPEHNAADYAAWTSSIDHIRATPGFAGRTWPVPMTVSENLRDLERHAEDFRQRQGFTYTVLEANDDVDAEIRSWVRADRGSLDRQLHEAVRAWLRSEWPFRVVEYAEREAG
jgi:hypothetical protein